MSEHIPADRILGALRFAPPDGYTTAEVAQKLGVEAERMGSRLSKLANYGQINREWERLDHARSGARRQCRWRSKDVVEVTNA